MDKRKPTITWHDLLKVYYPVMLTLKVQENHALLAELCRIRKFGPLSTNYIEFRKTLWRYFKLYIPSLTLENTREMFLQIKKARVKREWTKYWETNKEGRVFNQCRLYPLSKEYYQKLAERVWEKKGKPTFRKKLITGVKWGEPETERKHFHGTYMGQKVIKRLIGVQIDTGKPLGKAKFKVTIWS